MISEEHWHQVKIYLQHVIEAHPGKMVFLKESNSKCGNLTKITAQGIVQ